MSNHTPNHPAPAADTVAAFHRQGDQCRLVVLQSTAAGLRLLEAASFPRIDQASLRAAIERRPDASVLCVLPSSSVVCRAIEAPEGAQDDVAAALNLIAEATLPPSIPAHRRAAARIEGLNGLAPPNAAVVLGWNARPEDLEESLHQSIGPRLRFTSEPIALLTLLRWRSPLGAYADRSTQSLCLSACSPSRLVLRALRESAEDSESWAAHVQENLSRTAAAAPPEAMDQSTLYREGDASLRIDRSTRLSAHVAGVPDDAAWTAQYAIPLAAAAGALIASSAGRNLYNLSLEAPRARSARIERLARALAAPRVAVAAILTALALALLAPLALQSSRLAILRFRSGGIEAQTALDREEAARAAFHKELELRRWPMTALLADLGAAFPPGIVIESIRIENAQRVSVVGVAPSLELINLAQTKIQATGVFSDATIDRTQTREEESNIEFELSARVTRPHADAKGLDDYAERSLSQRLYGNDAQNTAPTSASAADSGPRARRDVKVAEDEPSSAPSEDRAAARRRSENAPKPPDTPEPITDEQIAVLDASAAMKEWTARQRASKQTDIDASTRDRLKSEADKCRQRMLDARKEAAP